MLVAHFTHVTPEGKSTPASLLNVGNTSMEDTGSELRVAAVILLGLCLSNAPPNATTMSKMLQCSIETCTNAQMTKCSNAQMLKWQMLKCLTKWQVLKRSKARNVKCSKTQVRQSKFRLTHQFAKPASRIPPSHVDPFPVFQYPE